MPWTAAQRPRCPPWRPRAPPAPPRQLSLAPAPDVARTNGPNYPLSLSASPRGGTAGKASPGPGRSGHSTRCPLLLGRFHRKSNTNSICPPSKNRSSERQKGIGRLINNAAEASMGVTIRLDSERSNLVHELFWIWHILVRNPCSVLEQRSQWCLGLLDTSRLDAEGD